MRKGGLNIIKVASGKYQVLNHSDELMLQGTYEECIDAREQMIKMSVKYEWEYMDIMKSRMLKARTIIGLICYIALVIIYLKLIII